MIRIILCMILAGASASAQQLPQLAPPPAVTLADAGSPIDKNLTCDATVASPRAALMYIDRSSTGVGKRLWLCLTRDGGATYSWQNFGSSVAATVQPTVTNTFALALSSYTGSVADTRAAAGMAVEMLPIGNPGGQFIANAWIDTPGTISYVITNLGVANSKLQSAKFALFMRAP